MKIRNSFVSNSSSTSFVFLVRSNNEPYGGFEGLIYDLYSYMRDNNDLFIIEDATSDKYISVEEIIDAIDSDLSNVLEINLDSLSRMLDQLMDMFNSSFVSCSFYNYSIAKNIIDNVDRRSYHGIQILFGDNEGITGRVGISMEDSFIKEQPLVYTIDRGPLKIIITPNR